MEPAPPSEKKSPSPTPPRVYLVGFMGCGKTSIGRRLAERLKWRFVDLDDIIEANAGLAVPEIFKVKGEEGFRRLERAALHETFEHPETVVATGGGTPCFFDNMNRLNAGGYSFYLKNTVPFFVDKLGHAKTERPLIMGKDEKELHAYIAQTLAAREPFYLQARYTIFVGDLGKKRSAKVIGDILDYCWNDDAT